MKLSEEAGDAAPSDNKGCWCSVASQCVFEKNLCFSEMFWLHFIPSLNLHNAFSILFITARPSSAVRTDDNRAWGRSHPRFSDGSIFIYESFLLQSNGQSSSCILSGIQLCKRSRSARDRPRCEKGLVSCDLASDASPLRVFKEVCCAKNCQRVDCHHTMYKQQSLWLNQIVEHMEGDLVNADHCERCSRAEGTLQHLSELNCIAVFSRWRLQIQKKLREVAFYKDR